MAKDVKYSEAADWSDKEAEENIAYLESRGRLWEVEQVKAARGDAAEEFDPTAGDLSGYDQPDDDPQDLPASYPAEAPVHQQSAKSKGAKKADVPDGSVQDVLDWVGDDKAKAKKALAVEDDRDEPRSTLVDRLVALAGE